MERNNRILVANTIYMYLLSFAKLIIPLISLPYLARILSVDCVGGISFVKTFVSYAQIVVDFGFLLSATKDIVIIIKNKGDVSKQIGDTLYAQLMLSACALIVMIILSFTIDALNGYELYAILSVIPVILSIFLFEYVFRAYEKMEKITLRYVLMRLIALVLTLIFVKSDSQIILMPIFDIIASIIALLLVFMQMKKLQVKCNFSFARIKDAFISMKKSCLYFFANFVTTVFSLFNTLIIGILLGKESVAYWTVAFQFFSAVNAMYMPIINSVYPLMLKEKKLKIINNLIAIFMPIILICSIFVYYFSDSFVTIVFGDAYIFSGKLIRHNIPLIIASFPALLYGWPCFSVINKEKSNIVIIILCAVIELVGILVIIHMNRLTLINLAIIRSIVEVLLAVLRIVVVYKNRNAFVLNAKPINVCEDETV